MIREQIYIQQTENLIKFYRDKNNNSIKEYILVCHDYINEIRNIDAIEIFTELEYERSFSQVLNLVYETYRPNHFNSIVNNENLRLLDAEFIVYILGIQNQLKKPITWKLLIDLQYKYSILRINWMCKNGFTEDFERFAIQNILISELFKLNV